MRAMSRVARQLPYCEIERARWSPLPRARPSVHRGNKAPRASLRDCAVGELKICTGVVTIHVLQIAFGPAGLVMLTVRCAMKGATHNILLHGIETTIARESELRRNGYLARYLFFLRVQ